MTRRHLPQSPRRILLTVATATLLALGAASPALAQSTTPAVPTGGATPTADPTPTPSATAPTTGTATPTPTTSAPTGPAAPTAGEGPPGEGSQVSPDPGTADVPATPVTTPAVTPASTAEVAEIRNRLAALRSSTDALLDEIAGAQDELDGRRADVVTAVGAADRATAASQQARAGTEASRFRVDRLVAATYGGARTSRLSAVLVATGPQDLLDRMTGLTLVSEDAGRALADAQAAVAAAEQSEGVARTALDAANAAEAQAEQAQAAVVAKRSALNAQVGEVSQLVARVQAGSDARMLAGMDVSSVTGQLSVVSKVRASQSGRPLYVLPTTGTYTSGFGARWGTVHQGIDLANSIGTPIVAAADGTVINAGAAQGFGQWVRIRHDDGTITVYGHVDTYVVTVGQQVLAGEQIATIGNRGESTGPHLHFEVIDPGGVHVDPVPWFAARGIVVR